MSIGTGNDKKQRKHWVAMSECIDCGADLNKQGGCSQSCNGGYPSLTNGGYEKSDAGAETDRFLKENSDLMDDLQKHDAGEVKEYYCDSCGNPQYSRDGLKVSPGELHKEEIDKLRADLKESYEAHEKTAEKLQTCVVALEKIEKENPKTNFMSWVKALHYSFENVQNIAREALEKVGKS